MILGIDAHKLSTQFKTGTDRVTYYFIKHITPELAAQFSQIIFYTKQPLTHQYQSIMPVNSLVKVIKMPYFWSSIGLSWEMKIHPPDTLFVPSHSLPFITPPKTATVIHDIGFYDHPNNYTPKQYYHLQKTTEIALKKASTVFTPSKYVKKTLIDKFSADPNKIIVAHLGVDTTFFHSRHSQKTVNQVLGKYSEQINKQPYIFFLGRIDYRKNIINLIKAFSKFKKTKKYPHILVISGKPGRGYQDIIQIIQDLNMQNDIILPGYISQTDLPIFYSEAELFLFPSLYEGFGIPVLEAQSCRTAVVTSNITSLPEIAGKGALFVNPRDVEDIAGAIKRVIDNPTLKQSLIEKGMINAKNYPWSNFTNTIMPELLKLCKKI
ncbi:glycosyltransferase family 4 protein [Patescibacteria group bacterium]|nr:glycosyltransferase family 4 protein [Patescibacteria group bacterium]